MLNEKALDQLLDRACPSIQYRLRREVLGDAASTPAMRSLQRQIMQDSLVQKVTGWQGEDGWLAWDFHGKQSHECGLRILCEKGLSQEHPLVSGALRAIESFPERRVRGLGKVGAWLDQAGLGGSDTITAYLFAFAGVEANALVQAQIAGALEAFKAVLQIETAGDLIEEHRGKSVLKQGRLWPSLYHLRLLALTQSWRSAENRQLLARSVQRLARLSPIPHFNVLFGSQVAASASFCMDDFHLEIRALDAAGWFMWFQRMELLARTGVVHRVAELDRSVGELQALLDRSGGLFTLPLQHVYFRSWGAYTGLMLEADWKNSQRRVNDLTFRSALILHYAEKYTE